MSLENNHADCTGRWKQELIASRLYWRCENCLVIAYHSDAVAEAALQENQIDSTLRQLADAGAWLRLNGEEERDW